MPLESKRPWRAESESGLIPNVKFGSRSEWAVGTVGEMVFADHREYVGVAMLYRTVVSALYVRVGPGFVNGVPHIAEAHDDEHSSNPSTNTGKLLSSEDAGSEDGQTVISPGMAVRLAKAFGGSAESWLRQQMMYDLARIREEAEGISVRKFVVA